MNTDRLHAEGVELDLQAGRTYDLKLEYYDDQRDAGVRLGWRMPAPRHRSMKRSMPHAMPMWWCSLVDSPAMSKAKR